MTQSTATPPSPIPTPALLVIGYGNPLRRDDGAGPRVADLIESLHLPNVQTLATHQLAPEHADPISRAHRVIFVDAVVDRPASDTIHLRKLEPGATTQLLAHAADPRTLLALARDVYGRAPEAWWLTIPAQQLGFGTDYSPAAEAGVHAAVAKIRCMAADNMP